MSAPPPGRGHRSCRDLFARLSEYLDGELDPGLCSRLESHLDDCPPCEALLESLRRTVAAARDLPPGELPEPLKRELLRAYRELRDRGPA